jgi:hypothetical protein
MTKTKTIFIPRTFKPGDRVRVARGGFELCPNQGWHNVTATVVRVGDYVYITPDKEFQDSRDLGYDSGDYQNQRIGGFYPSSLDLLDPPPPEPLVSSLRRFILL